MTNVPPPIANVPSAYADGYTKARAVDREAADNYIRHTTIGDPVLDPVMEDVSSLAADDLHRFFGAGLKHQHELLRDAPQSLRDFFQNMEDPPWLDHESFRPGVRTFHAQVDLMLVAFVTGVLVEGFSTLIAKSFNMTGRVAATTRRLRQNNRQLIEIFYPNGLCRENDGWKTSVRVRFVHARIRNLLAQSDEWNHEAWGTPLSAANLGLAISIFSRRLLDYTSFLGGRFSAEEQESVLSVWRYTGFLMGIPETILYTDDADAKRIYRIGYLCEPPPDTDSIVMANALINAIPGVAGLDDPVEKQNVLKLAYRLSRALLGNKLSDQYQYPKSSTFGTLFFFRMKQRFQRLLKQEQLVRANNFTQLLQISSYDDEGLSDKLPDHAKHSESSPW